MISTIEPQIPDNGVYSYQQASKILGLSKRTIYNRVKDGSVVPRVGKFGHVSFLGREIKRLWKMYI